MPSTRMLDGRAAANAFLEVTERDVTQFRERTGRAPGLAALLVGDDPASSVYVRMKAKKCDEIGIHSEVEQLSADSSTADVRSVVEGYNQDEGIDGILVQLPLPAQVDKKEVLEAVVPSKDVDGFHPVNVGRLVAGDPDALVACTPQGIIRLLDREQIEIEGERAVVIGRSDIVGKPIALLLMHRHATVTICHSRTRDLPSIARQADILIAAVGRPWMIDESYVKPGACVVDVGISRVEREQFPLESVPEDSRWQMDLDAKGYTLLGDVNPEALQNRAGALTPVPGGVGPLTIAMLLRNTVEAAHRREGVEREDRESSIL